MPAIRILNGPNLNRLGKREPDIYGRTTLDDIRALCLDRAAHHGLDADFMQTNSEQVMVETIHNCTDSGVAAIVINPAAWTHTSVAILDALKEFPGVVIEVHLSNIHQREAFRHHSYISPRANAVIAGCGADGYVFAIDRAARLLA